MVVVLVLCGGNYYDILASSAILGLATFDISDSDIKPMDNNQDLNDEK